MFGYFEKNRAHYECGQIFPFLIAILCVVLIMIMITVNLGQIGMYKTEVSNAADAGALAGASVLSSALLGFGLRSESMCGDAQGTLLAIGIALAFWWLFGAGLVAAILIYIAFIIRMQVQMQMALGEARLAWTNAKKTAMQFAFSNVGVDEYKPTFKDYLKNRYGITDVTGYPAAVIRGYYEDYYKGSASGIDVRPYVQTGFNRYMQDVDRGYWHYGKVEPGKSAPVVTTSGYGWSSTTRNNSYDDCQNATSTIPGYTRDSGKCVVGTPEKSYKNYENWVESKVTATTIYGLDFFSWLDQIQECIMDFLMGYISIPWFFEWMDNAKQWLMKTLVFWIFQDVHLLRYVFPMGLELMNGTKSDYDNQVNNNFLSVRVTRHKADKNLGLWKFRYGDSQGTNQGNVYATAVSHAFQEHPGGRSGQGWDTKGNYNAESETIRPVVLQGLFILMTCFMKIFTYSGSFTGSNDEHLFETELTNVY